ncbi:hypothetical protein CDV55_102953 [Aspergillus turcosus]|nr:hypothetical protein CDV55_102953 [Aspergillus turcosus]
MSTLHPSQVLRRVSGTPNGPMPDPDEVLQYNTRLRSIQQTKEVTTVDDYRWLDQSMRQWSSSDKPSLLVVNGAFNHRFAMRDLGVDIVEVLRAQSIPVVWVMKANSTSIEQDRQEITIVHILEYILLQLLQLSEIRSAQNLPDSLSSTLGESPSREEYFQCLKMVLVHLPEVYIIMDAMVATSCVDKDYERQSFWPRQFWSILRDLGSGEMGSIVKVMLISYGRPQKVPEILKAEGGNRLITVQVPTLLSSSVSSQRRVQHSLIKHTKHKGRSQIEEYIMRPKPSDKQPWLPSAHLEDRQILEKIRSSNDAGQSPGKSPTSIGKELHQPSPVLSRHLLTSSESYSPHSSLVHPRGHLESHNNNPILERQAEIAKCTIRNADDGVRPLTSSPTTPASYIPPYSVTSSEASSRRKSENGKSPVEDLRSSRACAPIRQAQLASTFNRPQRRSDFEIALICALRVECDAVEALFDEYYEDDFSYGKAPGDPNAYTVGRIMNHNVVLAFMPGMGKANSASLAASFRTSFTGIRIGIVVGICGGVPSGTDDEKEIILGDIVIGTGLVQFDFGRQYPHRVTRKETLQDSLSRPNTEIRSLLAKLSGSRGRKLLKQKTSSYLEELGAITGNEKYAYPGAENDTLFNSDYRHKHQDPRACDTCANCCNFQDEPCKKALESSCAELGCENTELIKRERVELARGLNTNEHPCVDDELEEARKPLIHFGLIASGDVVMKSGHHRDEIASRDGVIAFEMEGAGIWDVFPTVVIKGVCDYADSHKNKMWQPYAAATAACYEAISALDNKTEEQVIAGLRSATFNINNYHSFFALVSQDIALYDGTIHHNLLFSVDEEGEGVEEAMI